ncbi:hypothetical protein E2320_016087, partial [Naja naja]
KFSGVLSSTDA